MSALFRSPLALLLLCNALIHFALGWAVGLTADEAHYALYAVHLDWSYYDHPPLVGWLQWPLVALHAPDGILRLLPQGLWLCTAALIYGCAQQLQALWLPNFSTADNADSWSSAGFWAVLAYSLAPLLHLLGLGLLPDTLLMLFTVAVLWQTLRLLDAQRAQRLGPWLLLGTLLGLAGLSKYTAIFVALPVLTCLLVAHGLALLRRRGPWLALLLAVSLVLPVFVWNAQHGWISFAYQLRHGAGSHWQASHVLKFLLVQALLYPLLLWGAWGWWRARAGTPGTRLAAAQLGLLSFFALPFALLMYLAGGGSSLPHWTAPAWVALAPFAGLGLAALWATQRRKLIYWLGGLQTVVTMAMYALMLSAGLPTQSSPPPGAAQQEPQNPFADFYGWDAAGATAKQLAAQNQVTRLAVQNWTLASRLAWYARPMQVQVLDPEFDQSALWSGTLPAGTDVLLVDWSQMAYQVPVGAGQFQSCTPLQTQAVQRAGRAVAHFSFYLCKGWGAQPAPKRVGS